MSRLGETNINCNNERMVVIKECGDDRVDVIFEKDNSVETVLYTDFKDGTVKRAGTNWVEPWAGTPVSDEFGEDARIVEYISDENVTVQYETGEIVTELVLNDVLNHRFNRFTIPFADTKRAKNIKDHRNLTLEFVEYMLNKYRRCVMIRPCGFGKTWIGLKLFNSPRYQKCLFLHPNDDDLNSEKIKNANIDKTIDSHTFNWLWNKTDEFIKSLDYDLVFIDEIHRVGGAEGGKGAYVTYCKIKKLMQTHPETHFLGATATPLRMDGINVVDTMFGGHTCYPYEMEDAFEDGLLKRPHYYYCVYNVVKKIRDKIDEAGVNVSMHREEIGKFLKLSEDEINELDSAYMDKHINEVCHRVFFDKKYMRFIVFYLTHDLIDENKKKVEGWFRRAYPTYQVNSIEVSSRTDNDLKAVDSLPTEPTEPGYEGRIDLVFNCEMLCMGYHSEYITGLILDRRTQSLNKYMQMIGRILSCDNDEPVVIFDVADNIHSDFCFGDYASDAVADEEREPVVPAFDVSPTTFAGVIKKYPNARHWEDIREAVEKARLSEKLLKTAVHEAKKEERKKEAIRTPSRPEQSAIQAYSEPVKEETTASTGTRKPVVYIPAGESKPKAYTSPTNTNSREVKALTGSPRAQEFPREKYICNNVPARPVSATPKYSAPAPTSTAERSVSADTKAKVDEAWNVVKEKKMDFKEAVNYLAGIEDMYGTVNIHVAEEKEKEKKDTPRPYEGLYGSYKVQGKPYVKPVIPQKADNEDEALPVEEKEKDVAHTESAVDKDEENISEDDIVIEDEIPVEEDVDLVADVNAKLGFNHWSYYYNSDTKEMYQKYTVLENKVADIEKDLIDRFVKSLDEETCEKIIEKWHSYPGCEENYRNYSEVDKKAFKYKCLASVSSHLFGEQRVELVLRYMIEGKVA